VYCDLVVEVIHNCASQSHGGRIRQLVSIHFGRRSEPGHTSLSGSACMFWKLARKIDAEEIVRVNLGIVKI